MKITLACIEDFRKTLISEERGELTVSKYVRDVRRFADFIGGGMLSRDSVLEYKSYLGKNYAVSSCNSMLAAINSFFKFMGWYELCVKQFRVQPRLCCAAEKELTKEEYRRLVNAAEKMGNGRLCLILETVCGTGIRVSELKHVTLDGVRRGEVTVTCKGKSRIIYIVSALRKKLLRYARENGISSGLIFRTRSGKPLCRTNIWRDMKRLCGVARVSAKKVFPHNLRHLFARTFYAIEKDIVKLADILGHSNINTTRIYTVPTAAEHRRRMERLGLVSYKKRVPTL